MRHSYPELADRIDGANRKVTRENVKTVLILYEPFKSYIGDTCFDISRLRKLHTYFHGPAIDFVCINPAHCRLVEQVARNNPFVLDVRHVELEKVDFAHYDLLLVACDDEEKVARTLRAKYERLNEDASFMPAAYSIPILNQRREKTCLFQPFIELIEFALPPDETQSMLAHEIYISPDERAWADRWLEENGVAADDNLFVLLDGTTERWKLLATQVYFEVVDWWLRSPKTRILTFDQDDVGKELFYRAWLGPEKSSRVVVARNLDLRQAMCLIGSSFTRLIFGPSTGLLHCASGIFSTYLRSRLVSSEDVPLMVAYTGRSQSRPYNEWAWWGTSLAQCIVIVKDSRNGCSIVPLHDTPGETKQFLESVLGCEHYTAKALMNFFHAHYRKQLDRLCLP